jgi:hypothetical protein
MTPVEFAAGETLWRQGAAVDAAFLVAAGEVELRGVGDMAPFARGAFLCEVCLRACGPVLAVGWSDGRGVRWMQ